MKKWDDMHNEMMELLSDPEVMADPVAGPIARQVARLLKARSRAEEFNIDLAMLAGQTEVKATPEEIREKMQTAADLCIEMAGAYRALSRLLPKIAGS